MFGHIRSCPFIVCEALKESLQSIFQPGELFSTYKSPSETHWPSCRFGCCHGNDLLPRCSGGFSFPPLAVPKRFAKNAESSPGNAPQQRTRAAFQVLSAPIHFKTGLIMYFKNTLLNLKIFYK